MNNNEIFSAEIELNSTRAQKKLEELGKELLKQKENLQNLTKEGSNATQQEIKKVGTEINKLEKDIKAQKSLVKGLTENMEKLSKLSYDDLDKVLKALNKELRSGNIEKEYITKKSVSLDTPNYCCGDTTRTCDLQVMSLASYQLLHSAVYILKKRISILPNGFSFVA